METSICFSCNGSGRKTCTACGGSGISSSSIGPEAGSELRLAEKVCTKCGGSGEVVCPQCEGTGQVHNEMS